MYNLFPNLAEKIVPASLDLEPFLSMLRWRPTLPREVRCGQYRRAAEMIGDLLRHLQADAERLKKRGRAARQAGDTVPREPTQPEALADRFFARVSDLQEMKMARVYIFIDDLHILIDETERENSKEDKVNFVHLSRVEFELY